MPNDLSKTEGGKVPDLSTECAYAIPSNMHVPDALTSNTGHSKSLFLSTLTPYRWQGFIIDHLVSHNLASHYLISQYILFSLLITLSRQSSH